MRRANGAAAAWRHVIRYSYKVIKVGIGLNSGRRIVVATWPPTRGALVLPNPNPNPYIGSYFVCMVTTILI